MEIHDISWNSMDVHEAKTQHFLNGNQWTFKFIDINGFHRKKLPGGPFRLGRYKHDKRAWQDFNSPIELAHVTQNDCDKSR